MGTCLAVLSLAVILLAPPVMTDPDALTNLAVGRHISASGAVPAVDPFTFGAGEARWSNPEWLASLLMYQVHRLGGEAGLQRFKRALLAGAWCLLFGLAVARGAPPWLTLGLLLLLLPGTAWRFTLRNHLHLFVLVPLYGLVIHGALSRARPRLLLLLLPLALLWANLHASFVVGWFLLAAALVGALKQGRRDPVIRGLALILLVHPLLALISPHGIYNYGQLLDHLAQVSLLRQHIQEWRGPAETLTQTARTPLLLLMVVGAASFTPAYNRKDLHGLILLLGGLAAALVSQRFIPLLVFLAAPVVASSLHGVLARVAPLMARLAVGALLLVGALGVLRVARDAAADPPTAALGRQGSAAGALTVPHWLGARTQSPAVRRVFGGLALLQVAYLVLIAVGCAYVMEAALGLPYRWSAVLTVVFVFGYTASGGAFAHAFTNSAQGAVMLVMAVVIFASGWHHWTSGAVVDTLSTTGWTAPGSPLFSTATEVWLVPFVMGAALATQPHLVTKALYVKDRRDLARTLGLAVAAFAVFSLVLFAGVYARLDLAGDLAQDQVMARYLAQAFSSPALGAAVSVAILAASMSTLDGLLVALGATVANDLLPAGTGVWGQRLVLGVLGALTLAAALSPPRLVLILGQLGVYALVAASAGPMIAGLLRSGPLAAGPVLASAATALAVHFGLYFSGWSPNPGLTAAVALAIAVPVAVLPLRLPSALPSPRRRVRSLQER